MPSYTYYKTVTHYVTVDAASREDADEKVEGILSIDDEVCTTAEGDWEIVPQKA